MTISYPLSLPTSRGMANIQMSVIDVAAVSESPLTLTQQVQQFPGQRWMCTVSLPPMKRVDAEPWLAFLLALQGRVGTFLLGDPLGTNPQGVATGTPVVSGANQVGNQLVIGGFTHSITNILKTGDYIGLLVGSNYRLHKVLTNTNSNGSGVATVDIWPSLRESPVDGQAVTLTNARGQFRLASAQRDWTQSTGGIYTISFPALEVI